MKRATDDLLASQPRRTPSAVEEPPGEGPPRRVLIFASEVEYIARCVLDCPDREIGGDFFGHWTHTGCPAVQYVIGPGPRARGTVAFFTQDRDFLRSCGDLLIQEYGLQHIGEWHSHHQLGLPSPSGHDSQTIRRALASYGLSRFFLTIGTIEEGRPHLNGFLYARQDVRGPDPLEWTVLPGASPYRDRIGTRFDGWNYAPSTPTHAIAAHQVRLSRSPRPCSARPELKVNGWLKSPAGQQELRMRFESIRRRSPTAEIRLAEDETVRIVFDVGGQAMALVFPPDYPRSALFFTACDRVVGPPLDFAHPTLSPVMPVVDDAVDDATRPLHSMSSPEAPASETVPVSDSPADRAPEGPAGEGQDPDVCGTEPTEPPWPARLSFDDDSRGTPQAPIQP